MPQDITMTSEQFRAAKQQQSAQPEPDQNLSGAPTITMTSAEFKSAKAAEAAAAPAAASAPQDPFSKFGGLMHNIGAKAKQLIGGMGTAEGAATPTTDVRAVSDIGTGVKEAGSDVLSAVKGIAPPANTQAAPSIPGKVLGMAEDVAQGFNNLMGITTVTDSLKTAKHMFDAYEQSRSQGGSVTESLKAANDRAAQADAIIPALAKAQEAWKKNPTAETTRALADVAATAAAIYGGGEVMAPEAAAAAVEPAEAEAAPVAAKQVVSPKAAVEPAEAEVASTPKPGLVQRVKQVVSPKAATQPGAQATLRAGAEAAAKDAGVTATNAPEAGIRTLMDEPIAKASELERGLYDTVNKAAETDMKSLYDYRIKLQDALEDPKNIANEETLNNKLTDINKKISVGEAKVQTNLGESGPDAIKKAQAATQQRFAMEDGAKKLFDNEATVKGNVQHGVPEAAVVDKLIENAEILDKPSKFAPRGTPTRLQQMFGEEGAKNFKQSLYDAQKAGTKVADRNRLIKWVAGGATALGGLYELMK